MVNTFNADIMGPIYCSFFKKGNKFIDSVSNGIHKIKRGKCAKKKTLIPNILFTLEFFFV